MAAKLTAPRFPGLPGYPRLAAGLRELGLRHTAELIAPEAMQRRGPHAGFRILDGFRVQRAGGGSDWWLMDRVLLAEARGRAELRFPSHPTLVQELFDLIDAAMRKDVMALRHLELYQLLIVLGERGSVVRDRHVTKLGVEEKEALEVAALASGTPRFGAPAQDAAERLLDEMLERRLRTAARTAEAIPQGHGDERLARLCAAVRERAAAADEFLDAAARLAENGDFAGAARSLRRAADRALDDPRPRAELLRLALRSGTASGGGSATDAVFTSPVTVTGTEADASIDISVRCAAPQRPGSGEAPEYEFWRISGGDLGSAARVAVVADLAQPVLDKGIGLGETVNYAVIPWRAGRICGPVVASAPYLSAPDVRSPHLVPTPFGVRARWRRATQVSQVRVMRFGPGDGAEGVAVASSVDGFDDAVSGHGEYRYEVRCGYRDARGAEAWSAGWTGSVQLARWPAPVEIVRVEVLEDDAELVGAGAGRAGNDDGLQSVRVSWRITGAGDGRMTVWPYTARERGDDISHLISRLPEPLAESLADEPGGDNEQQITPESIRSAVVTAVPGAPLRLTGVSLLGPRAVAGDSVLIFLPAPRREAGEPGLWARRVNDATGEAFFSWPEPAALVRMVVEQEGRKPLSMVLPRSSARERTVPFPVGRAAVHVSVTPLVRPDADLAHAEALTGEIPALPDPVPPTRPSTGTIALPLQPATASPAAKSPGSPVNWSVPAPSQWNDPYSPTPAFPSYLPYPPAQFPPLEQPIPRPGLLSRIWRFPRLVIWAVTRIVLRAVMFVPRRIRSLLRRHRATRP